MPLQHMPFRFSLLPTNPKRRVEEELVAEAARMQIFVRCFNAATPVSALNISATSKASDLISCFLPGTAQDSFYVSYGGKLLDHESKLVDIGVGDFSTVELGIRVRGGGGDGGATGAESRDCYLKMYAEKKPDKVDPNEARLARWTRCALSAESLKPPCVIDPLGNVYNKEAIVNALLSKSLPKRLRYIRGLKDLITIELSEIPGVDPDDDHVETKFQCPITGQEFHGKFKFVALKGCGHVLSTRAFKEVQSTSCMVCYAEFKEEDKILLNGADEEIAVLYQRMEAERAKLREKKDKKVKDCVAVDNVVAAEVDDSKDGLKTGLKRKEIKGETVTTVDLSVKVGAAKKAKPVLPVPVNATKEIYQSIFTSSGNRSNIKETYSCRALPIGRN